MIDHSLLRKFFLAAVVVFAAAVLFNGWMGRRLTVIEESLMPSVSVAPSSRSAPFYGSNVTIDPSQDLLAPRPKVVKPRPPIQAAPEVEHHIPGGILVQ